jgi:hypothetical protein
MRLSLAIVASLFGIAHADGWRVKSAAVSDRPNAFRVTTRDCGDDMRAWASTIAGQQPTFTVTHELVTLKLGKSFTVSDRALVTPDLVLGFWDSPPWSDNGATLVVRLHPKPGRTSNLELLIIQRHSLTDRGDACFVEWQGEAERAP